MVRVGKLSWVTGKSGKYFIDEKNHHQMGSCRMKILEFSEISWGCLYFYGEEYIKLAQNFHNVAN